MAKSIFVNLPVADVAVSTAFYEALGMTRDARFSNEHATAVQWADTIWFMLLAKDFYSTFTPKPIADTVNTSAVLLALSLDSRAEVDALVGKAIAAGGTADMSPPEDLGFMYSRDFSDPDGHAFGPFFMNMAKAEEV